MRVLGIEVNDLLVAQWSRWLMPVEQPFLLTPGIAENHRWRNEWVRLTPELRDAFELYRTSGEGSLVWLIRSQAAQLPAAVRRTQPGTHRWPTQHAARDTARVVRYIEFGRRPSRHAEVSEREWSRTGSTVPHARQLAGRFAERSGPNCFGTVMGAAGVTGADQLWMQTEAFEDWLVRATRRGGHDDQPGTVLVWRDEEGRPTHAAITLGGGWLLHKPSQGWMSPTKILSVAEGKFSARTPGRHLTRHQLI